MTKKIFRITKDKERAKDLFDISKTRLEIIKILPRDKTFKIVEEYYEIIKELLTAIMYTDGYKTLSHIKLIEYFSDNYKDLAQNEIKIIDILRKFRIGIVYYGQKVSQDFIINNEDIIKRIINVLSNIVRKKIV